MNPRAFLWLVVVVSTLSLFGLIPAVRRYVDRVGDWLAGVDERPGLDGVVLGTIVAAFVIAFVA
jgi:hypothetical protein